MQAVDHIAVIRNTITYMRAVRLFPSAEEINNPGFKYYLKCALLLFSAIMFLIGTLSHIVVNCIRKTYINLGFDLSFCISFIGCYIYDAIYLLNIKNIVQIYRLLSDFRTFGKPYTFEDSNRTLNKLSNLHNVAMWCIIIVWAMCPWMSYARCQAENVGIDRQEICGVIVPVWLPFGLMSTFYKHVFYVYQGYSSIVIYYTTYMANVSLVETVEHVNVRLKHVKAKFLEAVSEKDFIIQRKKFNNAVEYHIAVLELVKMVNDSYSGCMFVNAFLVSAMLGCSGQSLIEDFSVGPLLVIIGWKTLVTLSCTCGQRLTNEGTALEEAIYNLDWTGADKQIQKDLIIVLLRCQMPVTLQARPLGTMNFSMYVAILKTAYTYLTFLAQTN